MKQATRLKSAESDNKMTEFIKKPIVQLLMQGGFMGVLIFVLYMNYQQTDRFMTIYEKQSKESAKAQVRLATALDGFDNSVNNLEDAVEDLEDTIKDK